MSAEKAPALITPRTLSGFRDYLPAVMLAREEVLRRAREVYRSYGFTPIDTPACESLDVLLGKGGDESDKRIFVVRMVESKKEEMGLRFDLTVPFARFSAQYINELGTPFKRYAMGPVWRGERPGQGRYREFWQCDFDTIGTTSNAADIEAALVINDLFTALQFDRFEIRINNRMVLNGLLEQFGVADRTVHVLRAIDKLPKIGPDAVANELAMLTPSQAQYLATKLFNNIAYIFSDTSDGDDQSDAKRTSFVNSEMEGFSIYLGQQGLSKLAPLVRQELEAIILPRKATKSPQGLLNPKELISQFESAITGIPKEQAEKLLSLVSVSGTNEEVLSVVDDLCGNNPKATEGVKRLRELLTVAKAAGVPDGRIKIDLSICRGLAYYTGTIYETFLTDLPGIGSVCSGGRYDNLASKYTKQVLPGVGASLGVDRLIAAMEELKHPLLTGATTPAQVLVVNFDAARLGDYQRIARALRAAGVSVEVFPDAKKVGVQLGYAEKRGFKLAVIAGPAEFEQGVWKVKDLAKREEVAIPEAETADRIRQLLSPTGVS
ncbi:HisS family protein [Gemmata sp. JC717]|uniref:histidine--tRNA ligase n=1 Tax=Gemmata algarum TaxID=2975278 RepID=UPI0021BA5248|nr:HisS family protein [Gemmata algarum]MDY3556078.1 HisS family protein [Gemmata algarum]